LIALGARREQGVGRKARKGKRGDGDGEEEDVGFHIYFLLLKQRLIAVLMEVLPRPIKNPANNFLPPHLPVVASEAMVEIQPCWRSVFGRGESDFLTQFGSGGGRSRKRCESDNIDCGVLLVAG